MTSIQVKYRQAHTHTHTGIHRSAVGTPDTPTNALRRKNHDMRTLTHTTHTTDSLKYTEADTHYTGARILSRSHVHTTTCREPKAKQRTYG